MKLSTGDNVVIEGCRDESMYKGLVFTVLCDPYVICGIEVAKIKCLENGKYFGGGFATEFLRKIEN